MSVPILFLTNRCFGKIPEPFRENQSDPMSKASKFALATIVFDALLSITCLIVGILGATSVIAMPTAAAYALIGVSGGITLLWGAMVIKAKCNNMQKNKQRFQFRGKTN